MSGGGNLRRLSLVACAPVTRVCASRFPLRHRVNLSNSSRLIADPQSMPSQQKSEISARNHQRFLVNQRILSSDSLVGHFTLLSLILALIDSFVNTRPEFGEPFVTRQSCRVTVLGVVLNFNECQRLNCFEGYSIFLPRNPSVARKMAKSYIQWWTMLWIKQYLFWI